MMEKCEAGLENERAADFLARIYVTGSELAIRP
jgi:hypothetical protein